MQKELGLSNFEIKLYLYNLAANAFVGVAGYLLFGGWRLFGRKYGDRGVAKPARPDVRTDERWSWRQFATLVVISSLIVGVILFQGPCWDGGIRGGRAADAHWGSGRAEVARADSLECDPDGLRRDGADVLLERTGGLDRFAQLVAAYRNSCFATGNHGIVSGILSVYSSTSGVVLPALLPTVPKLISQLGGGDPLALASSVVVAGHVVDSSPLSTIGALCIASRPIWRIDRSYSTRCSPGGCRWRSWERRCASYFSVGIKVRKGNTNRH